MPEPEAAPVGAGRNARRATVACLNCKRSKRRCDFAHRFPELGSCSNCYHKRTDCVVPKLRDKRTYRSQTAPIKAHVHGPTHPSPGPDSIDSSTNTTDTNGNPSSQSFHINYDSVSRNQQFTDPERHHLASVAKVKGNSLNVSGVMEEGSSPSSHESRESKRPADSIVSRVTARDGAFDPERDGELTYFGSTSIVHLAMTPSTQRAYRNSEGDYAGSYVESSMDFDMGPEPGPIVDHLLGLFWEWQACYLQVVHKQLFLAHKHLYDTEEPRRKYLYFNQSVLYAILAMASLISPDSGVRKYSMGIGTVVGDLFASKAKRLLDQDIEHPSILTIQTAVLLASRCGALGETALGWSYSGIASRMSTDLGLYADTSRIGPDHGISDEMAEVRRTVFWGCYIQDKLWSVYCGRPAAIIDDYISLKIPAAPIDEQQAQTSSPDILTNAVYPEIIFLSRQCSHIHVELYSPKNEHRPEGLRKAAETIHTGLLRWHSDLPEYFKWTNKNFLPTSAYVILMHMQFYFCLLLLHRPFIQIRIPSSTSGQSALDSQGICTMAAENITKLTRDYSNFYNMRMIASPAVHFLFIAATVHLINFKMTGSRDHLVFFQGCLSSLREIGHSYPHSSKAVTVLQQAERLTTAERRNGFVCNDSQQEVSPIAKPGPIQQMAPGAFGPHINNAVPSPLPTHYDMTASSEDEILDPLQLGDFDWTNFDSAVCPSPVELPSDIGHVDFEVDAFNLGV